MIPNNYQGQLQKPLQSGFNALSTTADVISGIDLSGKTAIITGGYAGIGLETTKTLARAGARIIVPARDIEKARQNLSGIPSVEIEYMDLSIAASIDEFAFKFLTSQRPLHLLINNAGIMWVPLRRDAKGFESQLSTNHLGHFQLGARLFPALASAGISRVISVSSFGHQFAEFNFEDPNFNARDYETLSAYGQSKTANNLFAVELDKIGQQHGIRAYSLHPGSVIGTDLGREAPASQFQQMGWYDQNGHMKPELEAKFKTVEQGAATTVWCATSPLLQSIGGVYCQDCDIAELDNGIEHNYEEPWGLKGVKAYSLDGDNAQRLWKLSEEMTGTKF